MQIALQQYLVRLCNDIKQDKEKQSKNQIKVLWRGPRGRKI